MSELLRDHLQEPYEQLNTDKLFLPPEVQTQETNITPSRRSFLKASAAITATWTTIGSYLLRDEIRDTCTHISSDPRLFIDTSHMGIKNTMQEAASSFLPLSVDGEYLARLPFGVTSGNPRILDTLLDGNIWTRLTPDSKILLLQAFTRGHDGSDMKNPDTAAKLLEVTKRLLRDTDILQKITYEYSYFEFKLRMQGVNNTAAKTYDMDVVIDWSETLKIDPVTEKEPSFQKMYQDAFEMTKMDYPSIPQGLNNLSDVRKSKNFSPEELLQIQFHFLQLLLHHPDVSWRATNYDFKWINTLQYCREYLVEDDVLLQPLVAHSRHAGREQTLTLAIPKGEIEVTDRLEFNSEDSSGSFQMRHMTVEVTDVSEKTAHIEDDQRRYIARLMLEQRDDQFEPTQIASAHLPFTRALEEYSLLGVHTIQDQISLQQIKDVLRETELLNENEDNFPICFK